MASTRRSAVVADEARERSGVMLTHVLGVVTLEVEILRSVKQHDDRHHLPREVKIQRLFIVDRRRLNDPEGARRIEVIKAQLEHKDIDAHVVWRDTLADENDRIKDWTVFSQPSRRLYIDIPDRVDGTRVAHATLVVSSELIEQYLEEFRVLSTYKVSHDDFVSAIVPLNNLPPPQV
jgi:hypothetical protein